MTHALALDVASSYADVMETVFTSAIAGKAWLATFAIEAMWCGTWSIGAPTAAAGDGPKPSSTSPRDWTRWNPRLNHRASNSGRG